MACGDKYKFLAVTGSGTNFDNPYEKAPTLADFEEWVGLAERIEKIANDHLRQLAYVECVRAGGTGCGTSDATSSSWKKYNELIPLQNQLRAQIEDLTGFWSPGFDNWTFHEPVQEAMEAVSSGLCLLEQANDAIISYGVKPQIVPGVKTPALPPSDSGIPWWVWVAVGGGVVLIGSAVISGMTGRRRNPEQEQPRIPSGRRSRAARGEAA
jgi:hypothetical protein